MRIAQVRHLLVLLISMIASCGPRSNEQRVTTSLGIDLAGYLQASYDNLKDSFPPGTLSVHVEQTTDLLNAHDEWTRFQSLQAPAGDSSFGVVAGEISEYPRTPMDDVSQFPAETTLQQFAIFRVSTTVAGASYSYDAVLTRFGASGDCFIGLYDPLLQDASTFLLTPESMFPGCQTSSAATPDLPSPDDGMPGSMTLGSYLLHDDRLTEPGDVGQRAPAGNAPAGNCTGDYSYFKSHRSSGWQKLCESFWGNNYWYFFTGSSSARVNCVYTDQRQLPLGEGLFRRKNDCEVSTTTAQSFPAVVFAQGKGGSRPNCADNFGGETTGAAKAQVLTETELDISWSRAAHVKIRKEAFVMQNKSSSRTTSLNLEGDCGGQYGPAAHGTAGAHYADTSTETVDKFKVNYAAGEAAVVAVCRPQNQWTCEDICRETDTRCAGNSVQTCEIRPATSKCSRWFATTDCAATGKVCSGEPAGCVCPQGKTACGGACVDTQTDVNNCGGCGRVCGAGQQCTGGVCGGDCDVEFGTSSSTCHTPEY
jgi:hypothetical protein